MSEGEKAKRMKRQLAGLGCHVADEFIEGLDEQARRDFFSMAFKRRFASQGSVQEELGR